LNELFKPETKHIRKFIIMSLVGVFLFMAPIPIVNDDGERFFNIPLGIAIDWVNDNIFTAVTVTTSYGSPEAFGGGVDLHLHHLIGLIAITISLFGTILAYTVKPSFIEDNLKMRALFRVSPLYFVTKVIAFIFVWMIFLGLGPDAVIASFTGDVMIGLVASLVTIFIFLAPTMPLITDFGLMEFIGIYIKKFVRALFTLPGRASVDLMASWFGSSVASVIITRGQHERGYYTGREAAVIAVNFSFVSLPFTFVVVRQIGISELFFPFIGIVYLVCIILAIVMPRIWPLRNLPDTYLEDVGKQINEESSPENTTRFQWALSTATARADKTTADDIVKAGLNNYLNIFMDLIPIVLAWGTLGLMVVELTDAFDYIAAPMVWFLDVFRIEYAADFAPAALVGFIDMFLPAIFLGGAPVETQFILGVLSIVQVVYLAETGVLIIKSRMPLNIGKLFIIFMMRTVFALPLIVLFTRLFLNL